MTGRITGQNSNSLCQSQHLMDEHADREGDGCFSLHMVAHLEPTYEIRVRGCIVDCSGKQKLLARFCLEAHVVGIFSLGMVAHFELTLQSYKTRVCGCIFDCSVKQKFFVRFCILKHMWLAFLQQASVAPLMILCTSSWVERIKLSEPVSFHVWWTCCRQTYNEPPCISWSWC